MRATAIVVNGKTYYVKNPVSYVADLTGRILPRRRYADFDGLFDEKMHIRVDRIDAFWDEGV